MKKIKLPVAIIGSLLLLSLVFGAGVYASQWLSFTGDNQIEQSENDVNEIMEILIQITFFTISFVVTDKILKRRGKKK